jgi:hypothetical protein
MMARYAALVGRRIEVRYREGDIFLPVTGILAADSGRSIFLEEHFSRQRDVKTFRWEIPYGAIVEIAVTSTPEAAAPGSSSLL